MVWTQAETNTMTTTTSRLGTSRDPCRATSTTSAASAASSPAFRRAFATAALLLGSVVPAAEGLVPSRSPRALHPHPQQQQHQPPSLAPAGGVDIGTGGGEREGGTTPSAMTATAATDNIGTTESAQAATAATAKDFKSENRNPRSWKHTMNHPSCDAPLLYKAFYDWQEDFLVSKLGATPLPVAPSLAYAASQAKGARVGSACYETEHFRKIRMTYFDGGDKVQVFNSLWYPRTSLHAPLLGVDLLCFGRHKVLAVVDCQPLEGRKTAAAAAAGAKEEKEEEEEEDHASAVFARIRDAFPSLSGTMSNRYYDANQFFSTAMLYGRFDLSSSGGSGGSGSARCEGGGGGGGAAAAAGEVDDGEGSSLFDPIGRDLMPAFQEYASAYVALVAAKAASASASASASAEDQEDGVAAAAVAAAEEASTAGRGELWVLNRQGCYDQYSAERDPAHALFKGYFGEAWASDYLHDFLFELSDREQTAAAHQAAAAASKAPSA